MNAIEARQVGFPGRLKATDLALAPASLTVLVGPNGAGKTSLLHALTGIGRPEGEVRIGGGQRLKDIPPQSRPSMLGFVPASRDLAWPLTVGALITLTAPKAAPADVSALLDAMALTGLAKRKTNSLSTGERSRVLIARALLPRPAVLILDEPFANLDPLWQVRLAEQLREEVARGTAVLFSAHDLDLAANLAERMLVMDDGRVAADGEPHAIMTDGVIGRVFGVERKDAEWRAL